MSRKRRGRGEGAVYQRGDGMWCASISAGYNAAGKRRRRVVYGSTKREAQENLRLAAMDAASGRPIDAERITVAEFLTRWVDSTAKSSVAPTTYDRYKMVVDQQLIPHIGSLQLGKIQPAHVEQLYAALSKDAKSARAQQLAGIVLGSALKHAVVVKLIPSNPVRDIPKPRVRKPEMKTWTNAEARAFLKAIEADRLHAMYSVALAGGLRQGELFGLQWTDVDFDAGHVVVQRSIEERNGKLRAKEPKSGKGRKVDLPKVTMAALSKHRAAMLAEGNIAGPVFCDTAGGWLRKGNVYRRSFSPLVKSAKVPVIRFHDLRHTCAFVTATGRGERQGGQRTTRPRSDSDHARLLRPCVAGHAEGGRGQDAKALRLGQLIASTSYPAARNSPH